MKKKIFKSMVLGCFMASLCLQAQAGVMKKLVEVEADDPAKRIEEQLREDEEFKRYQQEAFRQKEDQIIEKAKQILDEQVQPIENPPTLVSKPVIPVNSEKKPSKKHKSWFLRPLGVISGVTVGPFVGLGRGTVSKACQYAKSLDKAMGGDTIGNFVGLPLGAIGGAITGSVSGLANGIATGAVQGYKNPLTKESFSLAGNEYDPYVFLGGN